MIEPKNGQRSVYTHPRARKNEARWETKVRHCKHCGADFLPVRKRQQFCRGGSCRQAWWRLHRKDKPHRCICGLVHHPSKGRWGRCCQ